MKFIMISIMKSILKTEDQLRIHKITSNKTAVMEAFEPCDLGENLKEIDSDETVHRSLGLCWNLKDDTFQFSVPMTEKNLSRASRSIVNC